MVLGSLAWLPTSACASASHLPPRAVPFHPALQLHGSVLSSLTHAMVCSLPLAPATSLRAGATEEGNAGPHCRKQCYFSLFPHQLHRFQSQEQLPNYLGHGADLHPRGFPSGSPPMNASRSFSLAHFLNLKIRDHSPHHRPGFFQCHPHHATDDRPYPWSLPGQFQRINMFLP